MTTTDVDAILADYLHHLDSALHQLPATRRQQLVAEIAEHISDARSQLPDQSEATVRNLLDRVGRPEDIAAEAIADQPGPDRRLPGRWLILGLIGLVAVIVSVVVTVILTTGGHTTTRTRASSVTVPVVVGRPGAGRAPNWRHWV